MSEQPQGTFEDPQEGTYNFTDRTETELDNSDYRETTRDEVALDESGYRGTTRGVVHRD